ncbi:MAG: PP2C family protein-serine/threonine phosphatase [Planctomycetota bacterium]|nr:PP2C family protein-serine/threonine phosphatase [Planctomycetota bacterium]
MDTSRLKQIAQKLQSEQEMNKSIEVAQKRQRQMLPNLPKVPGFEFHAVYVPATTVSGDFYDFITVGDHLIGIAMGDVSGHGIEAGIIMGMAKKALQIYAKGRPSPKDTLCITNEDLAKDLDGETFVSASYGILDVTRNIFTFARAGHNPPFVVNPARPEPVIEMKPNGMVIGVDKSGKRFPVVTQEYELVLQPGDLVFQYTDGLVEAPNKHKEEFGEHRVKELLLKHHKLSVIELLELMEENVHSHYGDRPQEDDITLIGFKML